jgi:hypothetical protein
MVWIVAKNANSQMAMSAHLSERSFNARLWSGRSAALLQGMDPMDRAMRLFCRFVQAIRRRRRHDTPAFAGGTNRLDTLQNYSLGEVALNAYV